MKYPNAYRGVTLIYRAEIITLISTVLLFIFTLSIMTYGRDIITLIENPGDELSLQTAAEFLIIILESLIGGILSIIAMVVYIIGINSARKDAPMFSKALIWVIAGIVAYIVSPILDSLNLTVTGMLKLFAGVFALMAALAILRSILSLDPCRESDKDCERIALTKKVIIAAYSVEVAVHMADIVIEVLIGMAFIGSLISYILMIVPMIVSTVGTVFYICTLKQTTKTLGRAVTE